MDYLKTKKKDFKPQELLDAYTKIYADRPTLRQVQEVVLLDKRFSRTRSGYFQLAPVSAKSRWEPTGPLEWLVACLAEAINLETCPKPEEAESEIRSFCTQMLDFSDLELGAHRQLVSRARVTKVAVTSWALLPKALPDALGELCILGCVRVASKVTNLNRESTQALERIARGLVIKEDALARLVRLFGHRKERLLSENFERYLALELPDFSNFGTVKSSEISLAQRYKSDSYSLHGLDYVLFAEKRLRKIKSVISELTAQELAPPDPDDSTICVPDYENDEQRNAPELVTVTAASKLFAIPKGSLHSACRCKLLTTHAGENFETLLDKSEVHFLVQKERLPREASDTLPETTGSVKWVRVARAAEIHRVPINEIYKACRDGKLASKRNDSGMSVDEMQVGEWASSRNDKEDATTQAVGDKRAHQSEESPLDLSKTQEKLTIQEAGEFFAVATKDLRSALVRGRLLNLARPFEPVLVSPIQVDYWATRQAAKKGTVRLPRLPHTKALLERKRLTVREIGFLFAVPVEAIYRAAREEELILSPDVVEDGRGGFRTIKRGDLRESELWAEWFHERLESHA